MTQSNPAFQPPRITELSSLSFGAINPFMQVEEQQQQQQQQQQGRTLFLNAETQLPEETIVTKLTTEIRQNNRLVRRPSTQ